MSKEKETMALADALVAIQGKLKAPKNRYNKFGNYKYRSCEDILESVKPLLGEYGILMTIHDDMVSLGERIYVKAVVTVRKGVDSICNTAYAREDETKKGMDGSQITGTSSSYARKYALNGLFLIDDTKDADTDEYHAVTNQPAKVTAAKQPPMKQAQPKSAAVEEYDDEQALLAEQRILVCNSREEINAVWKEYAAKNPKYVAPGGIIYKAAQTRGSELNSLF